MNDYVHDAKKNWTMVKIHPIIGEMRLAMVGVVKTGRPLVAWFTYYLLVFFLKAR